MFSLAVCCMLEVTGITMTSMVVDIHLMVLGLDASGQRVSSTGDYLAGLANILSRARDVSVVVSRLSCRGLGEAGVVEAEVLGALVWARY